MRTRRESKNERTQWHTNANCCSALCGLKCCAIGSKNIVCCCCCCCCFSGVGFCQHRISYQVSNHEKFLRIFFFVRLRPGVWLILHMIHVTCKHTTPNFDGAWFFGCGDFSHRMQLFRAQWQFIRGSCSCSASNESDASRIAKTASHILIFNQACGASCRLSDCSMVGIGVVKLTEFYMNILIKIYIYFFLVFACD